jgi:serine/threonine protein kinase/uncharacterized Zn-binding protein involved in type VI secretion
MSKPPIVPPEERGSIFLGQQDDAPPEPDVAPPPPEEPPPPPPAEPASIKRRDATSPARPPASADAAAPGAASGATPAVNEVIDLGPGAGSYTLLNRLGKGGMAEVWRARRVGIKGFERDVAIKRILPAHLADDDDAEMFRKMFLDEARLVATLTHPSIAQVYDLHDRGDGTYYLTMEYVPGCTLRELITLVHTKGRHFSPGFACYVVSQLADALNYAFNSRGPNGAPLRIVHRDVNPKNIMVTPHGDVKLLDFGIAYSYLENRDRTRTGVVKGTYSYMSPEQADGQPDYDTRSDLFALGILFTELLTGSRPFDAGPNSETRTMTKILAAAREDIDTATSGLPEDLVAIINRALSREPADRYASGSEFATALRSYMLSAQLLCGPAEAASELHQHEDAPDGNATNIRVPGNTPRERPRVKVFEPPEVTPPPPSSTPKPRPPSPAPSPLASRSSAPTETRIEKRRATRERLQNPEDPKPRLIKPLLLIAAVAILGNAIVFAVIKMNRSDAPKATVESIKTPAQLRAEQEAEDRARLPQPARPQLADVNDPNAALATAVNPSALPAPPPAAVPPPAPPVAPVAAPRPRTVRAAPPPPPEPPAAPVRRRSLDTSTVSTFADAGTSAGPATLAKGTLIPAVLTTPADASNPGPVSATTTADVSAGGRVVIPKGSLVACTSRGGAGNRINLACDGISINGAALALSGSALGSDQMNGIPTGGATDSGGSDPAKNGAVNAASRVARRLVPLDGIAGDVTDEAMGASRETARRAISGSAASSASPAPKGTRFFIYVHSFSR